MEGLLRSGRIILLLLLLPVTACAQSTGPAVEAPPEPVSPGPWADEVIYFVLIDRFADGDPSNNVEVDPAAKGAFHGGDLDGLRQTLDEIADLGATVLWINPVVKNIDGFVTGAGFPDWAYHGYWADDFERLDPRFGSEDDLKALVDDCHARGLKVLLDVVYNHAGYGSSYLTDPQTRTWLRTPETGTCGDDDLTQCLLGLPDFKTELPEVAEYLLAAHLGLARRVGLDGFRLDTVKHIDHPFWKQHRIRARTEVGSEFFLLGEVWGGDPEVLDPWFSGNELDAGFDFGFQGSTLAFVQGRGRAIAFDRYLQSRERTRPGYHLAHFLSSHDVPGALYQLNGDTELVRLAVLLQFMTIGIPVIYYGEEVGRPGGDWPDNRSDMPWGEREIRPGAGLPRNEDLRADYQRLIAIRRAHPALSRGLHQGLRTEGDLYVFQRSDGPSADTVLVGLNRGEARLTGRVAVPPGWRGRTIRDLWREIDLGVAGDTLSLELSGRRAAILVSQP